MFDMTPSRQRRILLAAHYILLVALVLQPLYLLLTFVSKSLADTLLIVPAACFLLVFVSAILSVIVEQTTQLKEVRDCAARHIWLLLVLVLIGVVSATQASSWW